MATATLTKLKNFINGESVDAADGATEPILNPATGEAFAEAPLSTEEDINRAVAAARSAFDGWSTTTPGERALALLKIADSIEENADELFAEFLSGAESAGITVDRGSTVTGTHADTEYRCVPMSAQGIEASACVWREDRSVGMTLDASPDGELTSALFAAYDETHA